MAKIAKNPDDALVATIEALDKRVRQLERSGTLTFRGTRTDDPDGNGTNVGARAIVGELGDGNVGIRVWDSTGNTIFDSTTQDSRDDTQEADLTQVKNLGGSSSLVNTVKSNKARLDAAGL